MLSMKGDRDPEHKEHSEQVTRQSTWMKSRRPGESDPRTLGNKEALLLNAQLLPLELKSSCSWAESWGGRQTPHHLQTEDCRTENKSHWNSEVKLLEVDLIVQEEHPTESIAFHPLGIGWGFVWDRRIHSSLLRTSSWQPWFPPLPSSCFSSRPFILKSHISSGRELPPSGKAGRTAVPPAVGSCPGSLLPLVLPGGAFSSPWMPSSENRSESPPGVTETPRGLNSQIWHAPTRLCSTLFPKILLNYLHFSLKNLKNSNRTFVQLASWSYAKFQDSFRR